MKEPSLRLVLRISILGCLTVSPFLIPASTGCSPRSGASSASVPSGGTGTATATGTATVAPTATAPATATGPATVAWPVPTSDLTAVPIATATAAPTATVAAACYKGYPTGNASSDVLALGGLCAPGMTILPGMPVKHTFGAGERKSFPLPLVLAGEYRIIAVGGKGVKDVDLELYDSSGKLIAADKTPDDVMPMIHPTKSLQITATMFSLRLDIVVRKGAGEVAGAVFKR